MKERCEMSNDIDKPKVHALDNFADFDESVEGDEEGRFGGLLVGMRLKFTNTAAWLGVNNKVFTDRVLLANNVRRTEVKWGTVQNKPPLETRELQPGQKFRDLEALNELCPRSEWRMSYGQLKGPWERQYVVEFADLASMEQFSWPTSTIGGGIAVRDLVKRTLMKRQFENREDVWPVVKLSNCFMRTGYDGRQRPDPKIIDWYRPKEESKQVEAVPTPQLASPATAPAVEPSSKPAEPDSKPTASIPWEEEKDPVRCTLQEELKDKVDY
jgi:hypothetical protein